MASVLTRKLITSAFCGSMRQPMKQYGRAVAKVTTADLTYQYDPAEFKVEGEIKSTFDKHGVLLIRNLLDKEEMTKLKDALEHDDGVLTKAYGVCDNDEGIINSKLCVWNHPGNDITGMLARCEKVAGTLNSLMEGEMYHYHTKLMMKEPRGGGRWGWHQDFGYWYNNGCLYPDMATCFIAVDPCKPYNGCLSFVPGSHKCGKLNHIKFAGQYEADPDRLKIVEDELGICPFDMEPGDAAFFHSNTLHKSERNHSDQRRWAFVMAYNRASNNPVKKHHHPRYVPLKKVPNSAILECQTATDMTGKGFIIQSDPNNPMAFTVEEEHLN